MVEGVSIKQLYLRKNSTMKTIHQEYLGVNGEEVLKGDNCHDLWLILQQLDHPIYDDFLRRQIAFDQLRFPGNTLVVDPHGPACFKTVAEALDFAIKNATLCRFLLGSEIDEEARAKVSILVQPGIYTDDIKWGNIPKYMDIDVVGNVEERKYADGKGVEHPLRVVLKQTPVKLPIVTFVTPWIGLGEGRKQSLRLTR